MSGDLRYRYVLVLIASFALETMATGSDDARSGKELVAVWDALRSRIVTARITETLDVAYAVGEQPPVLDRTETTIRAWSPIGRTTDFSMTQGKLRERTVTLENSGYTADLIPAKGAAGQWILRTSPGEGVQHNPRDLAVLPWTDCLMHVPIPDWLTRPTVHCTRTEALTGRVTRLHFENRVSGPPKDSFDSLAAARLDLSNDPDRRLLEVEYVTRGRTSTATWRVQLSYKPFQAGELPILSSWTSETIQITTASPATSRKIKKKAVFEVEYNPTIDSREFYLSYYGLPEPPGIVPPSRPTPTYVWLLLAAGGFGMVTLGCRWLLKRRAKAVPPA